MRAIITGAANGIGRATALRFAVDSIRREEGAARLALVDLDGPALAEIAAELQGRGAQISWIVGDLADVGFLERVVATSERDLGGLDVLVSNAGMIRPEDLKSLSVDAYGRFFDVNTRPTWLLAKLSYEMLKASRGCVVATASVAGVEPNPPQAAYSASKAAQIMLVRQMAYEWARDGIRCNCVSPGPTISKMTRPYSNDPKLRAQRAAAIPLGRLGKPEDIAGAISFLAGPDGSFITGQNLIVDGGLTTTLVAASGSKLGFVE